MSDSTTKTQRRALRHVPVNLPRQGFAAESIYLELWRQYLASNPDALTSIFQDLCKPLDQRGARVAASFIVWMGCNAGMSFTFEAERLADSGAFSSRRWAFLAAWAISNKREFGINSGAIETEAMLTPGGLVRREGATPIPYSIDWSRIVSPSQADNDVIACMVCWWSSATASKMREIAAPLIESARRRELSTFRFGASHA